jgi:hypothetical protein
MSRERATKIDENAGAIKDLACRVAGCDSFPELAALALARRFAACGRRLDARRVLKAYLRQNPSTPRIQDALSRIA